MRIRDANQIAASILQQATLTSPQPGETPAQRATRAGALLGGIRGGIAGSAALTLDQRQANGLMGAIARWGTIKEIIPPMPASRKNLDMNQLAKRILDESTGDEPKTQPPAPKNEAAVELGRLGGNKGGIARKAALTDEERKKIAQKAAAKRWGK